MLGKPRTLIRVLIRGQLRLLIWGNDIVQKEINSQPQVWPCPLLTNACMCTHMHTHTCTCMPTGCQPEQCHLPSWQELGAAGHLEEGKERGSTLHLEVRERGNITARDPAVVKDPDQHLGDGCISPV